MNKDELDALQASFAGRNYSELDQMMDLLPSETLLRLLDSKSIRIGDTAASLLARRDETGRVIEQFTRDAIRTALGRVRATNILCSFGSSAPNAIRAYVHALSDKSLDVLSNGLFGIVFMRRRDLLPKVQASMAAAPPGSPRQEMLTRAVEALAKGDPSIYSPGYRDSRNIWRLDEPAIKDEAEL